MYSDHSATYSGKVNGTEKVTTLTTPSSSTEGVALPKGHRHSNKKSSLTLTREEPCGLTIIVGGTNVRFSLSHLHSTEPIFDAVKWQKLRDTYNQTPEAAVVSFPDSHKSTYPTIAQKCESFLRKTFNTPKGPIRLDNLAAFNVSVAGIVEGEGLAATVTTTNTLLKVRQETLAEKLRSAILKQMPELFPEDTKVRVLNDAQAGLEGEIFLNKLDPNLATLFLIFGTGFGSSCTVPGYAELGHLTVYDTVQHKFRFLSDEEIADSRGADGSFKPLKGLIYAENLLAGPWVAIGFVKCIARHHPTLTSALAEYISKCEREALASADKSERGEKKLRTLDEIMDELKTIRNFKSGERHLWAGHTNESTLRAINGLIFERKNVDLTELIKSSSTLTEAIKTDGALQLAVVAERKWRTYFEVMGKVTGVVYSRMQEQGIEPHKFIAGGGLGERCNTYNPTLRQEALSIIMRNGNLRADLFDFSKVSPEARESAPTFCEVVKRAEETAVVPKIEVDLAADPLEAVN